MYGLGLQNIIKIWYVVYAVKHMHGLTVKNVFLLTLLVVTSKYFKTLWYAMVCDLNDML